MSNPLIVEADDEDVESANLEGAKAASSWADLTEAMSEPDPNGAQVGIAAAAAGLDSLDAVMDPLGSLLEAGVGWLIEHVWFLHEPLDALAGDPTQITAQAKTWHNASVEMREVARTYRQDGSTLSGWDGAAADAYRTAVRDYTARLDAGAAAAEQVSRVVLHSGAAVGTVRALIRDLVAEFVGALIEWALAALAAALFTVGGSIAAFVVSVVVKAVDLATDIGARISRLLSGLHAAGNQLDTVAETMQSLPALRTGVRGAVPDIDGDLLEAAGVEAGKQFAEADQERADQEQRAGQR